MADGTMIDSLSVEIEAQAEKASAALDKLITQISTIQRALGGNGMAQFAKSAESMKGATAQITKAIKPLEKTLEELQAKYADLGKGIVFEGSFAKLRKDLEKYSNSLQLAKLNKQQLEMAGTTEGQMYEYAIRDIMKYSNLIDALKAKLEGTSKASKGLWHVRNVYGTEYDMDSNEGKIFNVTKPSNLEEVTQATETMSQSFDMADTKVKELNLDLARMSGVLKENTGNAEKTSQFSEGLSKIKDIATNISTKFEELKYATNNVFLNSGIKTYTREYLELQNEINNTEKTLAKLHAQMARAKSADPKFESKITYRKMQYDIEQATQALRKFQGEQTLLLSRDNYSQWNFEGISSKIQNLQKSLTPIQNVLRKVNSAISRFVSKIRSIIVPAKSAKKAIDRFSLSNSGLAKELFRTSKMLKLMVMRMALRGVIKNIQEGFQNLARYSAEFNASMSTLTNSSKYLSNSLVAMVSPIINALAPAFEYLVDVIVKAINAINMFFSVFGGSSTFIAAKKQTEDYAKSLDKANGSAKKLNQTVLGIDELNINSGDKNSSGGSGSTVDASKMFETLPIEKNLIDIGKKANDIFGELFNPIKKAWDKVGKFVMDAWKTSLEGIWGLIQTIGEDFLRIWNETDTQAILENLLTILGNIGLIVKDLADRFRDAWNNNEVGYRILANIRDIIGIIVNKAKEMSDYTVEWVNNLDFYPLLEAMNGFLESLKPAIEGVSGVLSDFYTMVLLPLSKWTLEKGLPNLFDVLSKFLDEINWEELRRGFAEFWKALEPFAEKVGEGLILFLDDVLQVCADIINSDIFKSVFAKLEEWMKRIGTEDIEKGLVRTAKALILLKVALLGLNAITAISNVIKPILKFLEWISTHDVIAMALSAIAKGFRLLVDSLSYLTLVNPGMIGELGMQLNYLLQGTIFDPTTWEGLPREIYDAIDTALMNILTGFGELFHNFMESLYQVVENTFNWDTTIELFEQSFEEFKKAFEGNGTLAEIGKNIIRGIIDGFLGAIGIIVEPIGDFFKGFVDELCKVFGIASPAKNMYEYGEYILKGIIEGFNGAVDSFTDAMQTFWDDSIAPWFTTDRWSELSRGILDGISQKWEEFKSWWNETALVTWWEEDVIPWFSIDTWLETAQGIYDGITQKWTETVNEWKKNIAQWWVSNVEPWFTLPKWQKMLKSIPTAFKDAFKAGANNAIDAMNKTIDAVETMVKTAIELLNKLIDSINKIPKVNIPRISTDWSFPRIPYFFNGGFPDSASLFWAGENGVAEMVGTVGGKTAVTSGAEITGIRDAIIGMDDRMNQMQATTNALLQIIADKDTTIELDSRELGNALNARNSRNGWSFT